MANKLLYSANPWIAHQIAVNYRKGIHWVWCSEYYDPSKAGSASAAAAIAPSSSPKELCDQLRAACDREDRHSPQIKRYRGTYCRLAATWLAAGEITKDQHDEIVAQVRAVSWRIWRPDVYLIPRDPIIVAGRLHRVPPRHRAAYGVELQIHDLHTDEFDIIEGGLP